MKKRISRKVQNVLLLLFLLLVTSCSNSNESEKKALARVNETFLYEEDLQEIIPSGISKEDSLSRIKTYIDFWVKKQALMQTAEINLIEEQKDVTTELEDYRMKLLIYRYKQKFIEQNLDTIVTNSQIEKFYKEHQVEFHIGQPVIKALFIKIIKTNSNVSIVKRLYRSSRERDMQQLNDYCKQNATLYNDFNNGWIYFKDLLINIPIRINDQANFLSKNNYIETQDSLYYYFAKIKNYRLTNSIAPLVFVKGNIQSVILNKRKQKIIGDLENIIFNNMLDSKDIELFNNE